MPSYYSAGKTLAIEMTEWTDRFPRERADSRKGLLIRYLRYYAIGYSLIYNIIVDSQVNRGRGCTKLFVYILMDKFLRTEMVPD